MKANRTPYNKLCILCIFILIGVITIFIVCIIQKSRNNIRMSSDIVSIQPTTLNEQLENSTSLGIQVVNTLLSSDLDGDGVVERIFYTSSGRLYINDKEYTDHLALLDGTNPLYDGFYLIDINSNDQNKEIGICSYGRSDDLKTFFYYYKDNELLPMGIVDGFPDSELYMRAITIESEGTLKAPLRLSILQTWWGYQYYELNHEHQLSPIRQDYYEPTIPYYSALIQPLSVYSSPELTADNFELSDQDIHFILTDNIRWCKVKAQSGVEGWFYIENGLINGTSEPTEVFQDLALYD